MNTRAAGPGASSSPWRNPQVLLTLLLVFLCGSAAGGLGMKYSVKAASTSRPAAPSWKEGGREITLERFKKELDLSPEQANEIEIVLDDFMMYFQTLQSQIDEVRSHGKERVLRLLKDPQKEKFNRMMAELQKQHVR